jgi:RNAse (barnase) inhibitor barstar
MIVDPVSTQSKVDQARRRGAMPHPVDGSQVHGKLEMLDAIADALSFPDCFGRNLEALNDCLTDLSWLPEGEHVLIWSAPHVLRTADPYTYQAILDVLTEAEGRSLIDPSRTLTVVVAGTP